jgi:hypothetical protein
VVYGTVYAIPEDIGMVDISTFGSILLHVRDPFLALQSALRLTRETVIVTEATPRLFDIADKGGINGLLYLPLKLLNKLTGPFMEFLPNFSTCAPKETWWSLSPQIIVKFIGLLGFEEAEVKYHIQKCWGHKRRLYTVVGRRTKEVQPNRYGGAARGSGR